MGKHEKERAVMHWLRCYVKGHRLTLVLPLVAVVYVISALSGGVPAAPANIQFVCPTSDHRFGPCSHDYGRHWAIYNQCFIVF